jgi:hypothetical protein
MGTVVHRYLVSSCHYFPLLQDTFYKHELQHPIAVQPNDHMSRLREVTYSQPNLILSSRVSRNGRRLPLIGDTVARYSRSGRLQFLHVLGLEANWGYACYSPRGKVWTVRHADTAAGPPTGIEQKIRWNELRDYAVVPPEQCGEHQALRLSSGSAMTTLFDSPSTIMHFDELPNPHLPLDLPTPERPRPALCQQFKCKEFNIRPKEKDQKNCRICIVKSVLQDSPAFHAGLTLGVQILKVNGQQVFDRKMPLAVIRETMSIPTGQKITLEVRTLTADEEARVL